jgi:hypothetical protein
VDHRLAVAEQQAHQQGDAAAVAVDGPQHAGAESRDVTDQLQPPALTRQ